NISLAAVLSREQIRLRTWERGAGLTKACGSAACAAVVAAARLRRIGRKARVSLPGGELAIEWRERDDHVLMTGPVEYEYEGRFDPALFAAAENREASASPPPGGGRSASPGLAGEAGRGCAVSPPGKGAKESFAAGPRTPPRSA